MDVGRLVLKKGHKTHSTVVGCITKKFSRKFLSLSDPLKFVQCGNEGYESIVEFEFRDGFLKTVFENEKGVYSEHAVKQVLQFSQRMFNWEKGLFMHGWVQDMVPHPQFHWARANGWAIMAMIELLDVLPENHPGYTDVLKIVKAHIQGLAACQSGQGYWHQLLDRSDSYLETSATAIFTYSIARAINRGYVDAQAFGPVVLLAWNAVSTKVNDKGQVEGTCVGTGMAFDPAFYYHRPVNVFAAHGYGPVLLAGAEVIALIRNHTAEINDSALIFLPAKNNKNK